MPGWCVCVPRASRSYPKASFTNEPLDDHGPNWFSLNTTEAHERKCFSPFFLLLHCNLRFGFCTFCTCIHPIDCLLVVISLSFDLAQLCCFFPDFTCLSVCFHLTVWWTTIEQNCGSMFRSPVRLTSDWNQFKVLPSIFLSKNKIKKEKRER